MIALSSLARLGRTYLDYTFPARDGARVWIVERPGRWMDPSALERVVDDIRAVIRRTVPEGSLAYGVATGDPASLRETILTIVYASDGRAVAFNALSVMRCELRGAPVDVLHLGLGMVDPAFRNQGLCGLLYGLTCFLVLARNRLRPLWISNVTQVPAVFGVVSDAFTNVFPAVSPKSRRSFDHLCLARQIVARHRHVFGTGPQAAFDESRFVIIDSYTGGSENLRKCFDDAPKHRTAGYNETCARELDYDRGDDFLQIGQWTLGTARRHFMRFGSVVAPRSIALRFLFLLLESSIAPVLQWLDASHAMGELRPWGEPA